MSNTTIAAPVQSTEFDYATASAQIAATLDNSKDFYQASKQSYLAVKDGAVAATLAKSISSTLSKSHKDSTIKSISPSTLGYRIAAARFIIENELHDIPATINATYTLVSKTSGVRPGLSYLPEILASYRALPSGKQTRAALLELIDAANESAKPSAKPKVTTPKVDETPEPAIIVQSTEQTAEQIMAYVRANTSQKFSNADRRALAEFFTQTSIALRK